VDEDESVHSFQIEDSQVDVSAIDRGAAYRSHYFTGGQEALHTARFSCP
jgi:hypothetical protein